MNITKFQVYLSASHSERKQATYVAPASFFTSLPLLRETSSVIVALAPSSRLSNLPQSSWMSSFYAIVGLLTSDNWCCEYAKGW